MNLYENIKNNLKESSNKKSTFYVIEPEAGIYGSLNDVIMDYVNYKGSVRSSIGTLSYCNYYNLSEKEKRKLRKYYKLEEPVDDSIKNMSCLVLDDSLDDKVYFGEDADKRFDEIKNEREIRKVTESYHNYWN